MYSREDHLKLINSLYHQNPEKWMTLTLKTQKGDFLLKSLQAKGFISVHIHNGKVTAKLTPKGRIISRQTRLFQNTQHQKKFRDSNVFQPIIRLDPQKKKDHQKENPIEKEKITISGESLMGLRMELEQADHHLTQMGDPRAMETNSALIALINASGTLEKGLTLEYAKKNAKTSGKNQAALKGAQTIRQFLEKLKKNPEALKAEDTLKRVKEMSTYLNKHLLRVKDSLGNDPSTKHLESSIETTSIFSKTTQFTTTKETKSLKKELHTLVL